MYIRIRSSWTAIVFFRPPKKQPKNVIVRVEWRR